MVGFYLGQELTELPEPMDGVKYFENLFSRTQLLNKFNSFLIKGNPHELDTLFSWDSTPQGYEFWDDVFDGNIALEYAVENELDKCFIPPVKIEWE